MEHFSSKFNSNFSCFVSNFKKFLGIHFFNCVDEFGLTFSIIWIQWRHFFLQFSSFPSKKAFLPQFNSKKGYFLLIPEINICCINPFSFSAIAFMCTDLRVKFLLGQREGGALSHPVTTIHQTTMWSAQTFCQRNSKAMSLVWKPLNMKVHLNIRTAKLENGLSWGHACRPQDTEQIARWNTSFLHAPSTILIAQKKENMWRQCLKVGILYLWKGQPCQTLYLWKGQPCQT